ncbi:methylcobalamin:coenzyme M methyltransferase [Sedimentisphaera cyanobacteriorum]|uniref:Methylcobalamin:coenzyme M methyltransferase n=1 Tax=Sedimentisphaera cyanobacteriorum TaxID=1940790 RepID=A0A1Q2HNR4_9BACT|nr:uroporphyrinogen decarboxylase family protein [Sedimentisphaera cyanobacteriorum]AQQ09108.1 methylcobalamin:coenzyme M methyltransferase [Sedimentisphaera cyanobacteriorum]
MIDPLKKLLKHLNSILEPERQEEIEQRHKMALQWQDTDRLPLVMCYPLDESANYKPFPHREIFDSPEKMLYNELVHAFDTSIAMRDEINDDLPLTVRANFGTVLVASMFGCEVENAEDNPPWARHLESKDEFEKCLDNFDPSDFSSPWMAKAEKTLKVYKQILSEYPKLKNMIQIVLPDLQGPLDNAAMVRGSEFFVELLTEPELTAKAMKLAAQAQANAAKHFSPYLTEKVNGFAHQHAAMIRGNILLRNDSSVMISPEMYSEKIACYDDMVLNAIGKGSIHSCGKIGHVAEKFMEIPHCLSVDFGQPEMNDLDTIYSIAKERNISLIRVSVSKEQLISGEVQKRFPTGVSLVYRAESFAEAQEIMKQYAGR